MILRIRPHFSIRDGMVVYLNSKHPIKPFTSAAQKLLAQLQDLGSIKTTDLDDHTVSELVTRGVCDLIAPIHPVDRTRVLVLEPHSDDAALSIGGHMWQRRMELDFDLVTMASRTNYTTSFLTGRSFFNRDKVTNLRKAESEMFMEHLGGSNRPLDLLEASLRFADEDWSAEFYKANHIELWKKLSRRADDETLKLWSAKVEPIMCDPGYSEIWVPIGAGTHSDHDLTRNAALTILLKHPEILQRAKVFFYKDVPYGADCPEHTKRILSCLRAGGGELAAHSVDITASFEKKLGLLAIFAAQHKPEFAEICVRRSASSVDGGGQLFEHLWQLDRLPKEIDLFDLFNGALDTQAVASALAGWCDPEQNVSQLHVLALSESGDWPGHERALKAKFPKAKIKVYARSFTRSGIAGSKSSDVILKDIGFRPFFWLLLTFWLTASQPAHVLVVTDKYFSAAKWLSRLWPLRRTIVVKTLDHMTLALQRL